MSREYTGLKIELPAIAEVVKSFPEALQTEVFRVLVKAYIGEIEPTMPVEPQDTNGQEPAQDTTERAKQAQKRPKAAARNVAPKLVTDLNLNAAGQTPSFKDFCEHKKPKTDVEFNTVAIFYLSELRQMGNLGVDHLLTCYREVGRRLPKNMDSSVTNCTRTSAGYLLRSNDGIVVTNLGRNLVNHELPAASAGADS
jgi:hypothetical protein